jgi:hypothetical protein
MAEIPFDYRKDFSYLKEKSDRATLQHDNVILKKLEAKAKNLPGLKAALGTLRINY